MSQMKLIKATKYLLDFMFWSGLVVVLALPWIFKMAGEYIPNLKTYYLSHVVLFMLSGFGAVLIIRELRRIMRTVLADDCFVRQNVMSLRRMGALGFFIAAITAARLILVFTPATVVIIIVFFIAALFSLVLAEVFDKAISFKEENDLTI